MPKNRSIPAVALGLLIPIAALAQNPGGGSVGPSPVGPAAQGGFALPDAAAKEKEKEKEAPPTEAEKVLDDAVARLKKADSVSAEIVQSVAMLGQKFEVKGTYLKAGADRVYLKLAVSGLGDASATTLQACDGTTLWDYRQVLDTQTYVKYSIGPILKKLADPALDPPMREQATAQLGFAGPDALIQGLRKKARFDQKAEESLDGKPTWVIRGQWTDRSGLVGPNQQPLPPTVPLPPYIPSNVAVWVGRDDGFPYKVEMYGNAPSMLQADTQRMTPDGRPITVKAAANRVEPSRIVLRYTDVKLNAPIKPESFGWQPPADAKGVVDATEQFLAGLDQAIQYATALKKAEAAKGESTLPDAIDVPKPKPDANAPAPAARPSKE